MVEYYEFAIGLAKEALVAGYFGLDLAIGIWNYTTLRKTLRQPLRVIGPSSAISYMHCKIAGKS